MRLVKRHFPAIGRTIVLCDRQAMKRKVHLATLGLPCFPMIAAGLPPPRLPIDWTKGGQLDFPVDGNDDKGDCEYAAACHGSNTFTGCVGQECYFDPGAIIAAYLRLSGGDNGLDTDTMMAEWKRGLCGTERRIFARMAVRPTDSLSMQSAIAYYGGVFLTLGIPDLWLQNIQPGMIWDDGPGVRADDNNGHAVWLNGVNSRGYTLQTWGLAPPVTITPAGIAVCDPECDVVASLDWFNAQGVAPNGYTYEQLGAEWVSRGGQPWPASPFPPVPPSPPPPPGPGPIPPGPSPWPTILAAIWELLRTLGPLAVPILDQWIEASGAPAWLVQLVEAMISVILGAKDSRFRGFNFTRLERRR